MDKPEPLAHATPTAQPDSPGPWLQLWVPRGSEFNRYSLPIPNLPRALDGFRILHLSDLHLRPFWSEVYDQLLTRIRDASPDLILVTGDFVNNKRNHIREAPFARRFVSQLHAPYGVFGTLGNHDRYHLPLSLENTPVTFLDGRRHVLEISGAPLELIGLPGVHRNDVTDAVFQSFPPKDPATPRLVLSHYPDILRRSHHLKPDIYFAGHTHGGQICLPGGVPIIRHDSLPRRLTKGVHKVQNTWLVVSRGLGFTTLPIRMFCPTEMLEITLTSAH